MANIKKDPAVLALLSAAEIKFKAAATKAAKSEMVKLVKEKISLAVAEAACSEDPAVAKVLIKVLKTLSKDLVAGVKG